MTLARVRELAETGVDIISVGALTHSARAVDLSLELELLQPDHVMPVPADLVAAVVRGGLADGPLRARLPAARQLCTPPTTWPRTGRAKGPPKGWWWWPTPRAEGAGGWAAAGTRRPGENLYFSLLLRPQRAPLELPPLTC